MNTLKRQSILPDWLSRTMKNRRSRRQRLSVWMMNDLGLGYVAVPKAASSSIRNLIREREGARLFPGRRFTHDSLKATVDKLIRRSLTPTELWPIRNTLRLFSFVRNPLTRLHSCYRDKVVNAADSQPRCSLSPYGINFGMSFDTFVERVADIPDDVSDQHFRSQHTFLTLNGSVLVHMLGKLETLDEHWQQLTRQYALAKPTHERRVSGPPVPLDALPLSRRGASLAIERYRGDIELFDYADEIASWRRA